MTAQPRFYDVYVSYPPGEDPERVNSFLRDNLPDEEASDIINALTEQRQAIIAERCTDEERQNAQHYFNYLGLDVIVRLSLEFAEDPSKIQDEGNSDSILSDPVPQCPVCYTILEDSSIHDCPTCGFHLENMSETTIQRKRIEWQERIAFEHRKKHEIAYKLLREKQEEEKQLRKQIRAELEEQLMVELGQLEGWRKWFHGKYLILTGILLVGILTIVLALAYMVGQLFFTNNASDAKPAPLAAPTVAVPPATEPNTNNTTQPTSNNAVTQATAIPTPAAEQNQASAAVPKHHDLPEVSVPVMQPINASQN
ncbi:MAG: hypothetical protein Q4C79_09070 [Neisseria sp.]|uniref:hypothetical protein n=1 Tax=Neisseria sp. TaxID=192066 RepID=UPI0026DB0F02|nr:hypothetical protein [Neisseria sp.]MDO4249089.1 hypothetical protein [Neisseria sp.]